MIGNRFLLMPSGESCCPTSFVNDRLCCGASIGGGLFGLLYLSLSAAAATEPVPDLTAIDDQRMRLTERLDENRVEQPWTSMFLGHPLSASFQYELAVDWLRQLTEPHPPHGKTRVLLEQQAEGEIFYTLGPSLSFFAQARLRMERDLRADTLHGVSTVFWERGEMWLTSENILGLPLNVEIGRLDFEDDRRWWWDDDLDAMRITVVGKTMEFALAVGQELGPTRTDHAFIEPARQGVLRVIAEASWDCAPDHTLQAFALHHHDRSARHRIEEVVEVHREDEVDAKLTWLGARATGMWRAKPGFLHYWVDTAGVRGEERTVNYLPFSGQQSIVEEGTQRTVSGWAVDLGLTWTAPVKGAPRLSLGYARGSGNKNTGSLRDSAFRQTGLNSNAPGFGGVQGFSGYGMLLDPELSNLAIVTVGIGRALFTSSSLDLVYHAYRQIEPANSLRYARLETGLTGQNRDLGRGLDLVLAVEESDWLQFEVTASAFHAGKAFGPQRGEWTFGGFAARRLAF